MKGVAVIVTGAPGGTIWSTQKDNQYLQSFSVSQTGVCWTLYKFSEVCLFSTRIFKCCAFLFQWKSDHQYKQSDHLSHAVSTPACSLSGLKNLTIGSVFPKLCRRLVKVHIPSFWETPLCSKICGWCITEIKSYNSGELWLVAVCCDHSLRAGSENRVSAGLGGGLTARQESLVHQGAPGPRGFFKK